MSEVEGNTVEMFTMDDNGKDTSSVSSSTLSSLKKGPWSECEIEALISALSNIDDKKNLWREISKSIKTRNHIQCKSYSQKVKQRVEKTKKSTVKDKVIYDFLQSINNDDNTTTIMNGTNDITNNKDKWSKYEIEAFISALSDIDGSKYLYEQIAQKVKTRSVQQCKEYANHIKHEVIANKHTPDDYVIYYFLQIYDKNTIINTPTNKKLKVDEGSSSVDRSDNNVYVSSLKDTSACDTTTEMPSQALDPPPSSSPTPAREKVITDAAIFLKSQHDHPSIMPLPCECKQQTFHERTINATSRKEE